MLLPPGTILQRLYLRERLACKRPGVFIEVGPGSGHLSRLLLDLGWKGIGIEPDEASARTARRSNQAAIDERRYDVLNDDWLAPACPARIPKKVDLILSSMVLEHLDEAQEVQYLARCGEHLRAGGTAVLLVPANERAWGIEDVAAGHFRRYSRKALCDLLANAGWTVSHVAGLTYPVSNALLPISNWLVARAEADKASLGMKERTLSSGRRQVPGKTVFPKLAGLVLNEYAMYPLHLLQRALRDVDRALVLYAEAMPPKPTES